MYNYKIGYNTMEESSFGEYQHKQRFTKDQLMVIIEDALYSAYNPDVQFKGNIGEIMNDLNFHKFLLSKGFTPLKYENHVTLFGWNSVDADDGIWEVSSNSERDMLIRIRDKIKIDASKNAKN